MPEMTRQRGDPAEALDDNLCYSHAANVRFTRTPVKLGNVRGLRATRRMRVTHVITALRKRAGLSMEQAAKAAGWKARSGWQRYEDERLFTKRYLPVDIAERMVKALSGLGNPPVSPEDIMALTGPKVLTYASSSAAFRTVRVVGVVEAGVWREALELPLEEQEVFPMPSIAGFENVDVFGLRVRGPSMNKLFADGSVVFFIKVPDIEPMVNDIVVVAAKKGALYETTLKQLGRDKKGKLVLYPRSTDPRFQQAVYPDQAGAEDVEIIGVAVAKHEPILNSARAKRR